MSRRDGVLSQQELRLLSLLSHGFRGREIAEQLEVSLATVRAHTRRLVLDLDACTVPHAVRIAFEDGLLKQSEQRRSRDDRREVAS